MGEQQTFAGLAWSGKKKQTRRELFLAEMNAVLPWAELRALIAPHYPTGVGGRRSMPLERMLRIYFLQHWYDLSDPAAEDALYDSEAMRRFVGVELGEDAIPDETTILHFRHLLERHQLTEQMLDLVRRLLERRGRVLLRQIEENAPTHSVFMSSQSSPSYEVASCSIWTALTGYVSAESFRVRYGLGRLAR